jgi:hypothetical protein
MSDTTSPLSASPSVVSARRGASEQGVEQPFELTERPSTCFVVVVHRPTRFLPERHHVFPLFLCELAGVDEIDETVLLCPNCHDYLHHLLAHLLDDGTFGPHKRVPAELKYLLRRVWVWWSDLLTA